MQIQLHHISLRLGESQLFGDFSLEVKSGEKILIGGSSGSGKSTLLRMILGFVQAEQGEILLDGETLSEKNVWSLRRRMGFVGQGANIGSGPVRELIGEIFSYRANRHLNYDESQTLSLFEQFRLAPHKLNEEAERLSGGERQRLALIIALLLDRELYLLDEVTSSIDEELRTTVMNYLTTNLPGTTMLIVSHNQGWKNVREIKLG